MNSNQIDLLGSTRSSLSHHPNTVVTLCEFARQLGNRTQTILDPTHTSASIQQRVHISLIVMGTMWSCSVAQEAWFVVGGWWLALSPFLAARGTMNLPTGTHEP
jgi:hypothetical protein